MKVNVWFIISQHFETLSTQCPDGRKRVSFADILLFFGAPIILGCIGFYLGIELKEAVFELSVSVFAIFSALLLSVQVAMYGVFKAERKALGDKVLDNDAAEKAEEMRILLREVNTNISYLILISCVSVSVFLLFFATNLPAWLKTGVLIAIYTHFILTLAMVLKRAHIVFDSEYRTSI